MTTYYLCPLAAILQYFNNTGVVLSGGKVYTYLAGTSTPQTTYTDSTGGTPNANPIILDSSGRIPNVTIWQPGGVNLKLTFTDASGNPLGPTFDQVSGINDPAAFGSVLANPASGSGADLIANAVRSYDIFSSIRASNVPSLAAGQTLIISVEGGSTPGDGLAGQFYWNASSSAPDDGINIIKPTAVGSGNGRYVRVSALYDSGTFTGTLTGMGGTTTGTVKYWIVGKVCMLAAAFTGTSNAASMTLTGLPTICQPQSGASLVPCMLEDNGSILGGWATVGVSQINFGTGFNNNQSGFTSSGTKGLPAGWLVTYSLG